MAVTDEFKELERLRSLARHNEASALRRAREIEREKWQGILADKDRTLAEKETKLAEQGARIAELEARLTDKQ